MEVRPIDANALNERFEELKNNPNNSLVDVVFLDGAMSVVDVAPTLDYEPVKRGKWIMVSPDGLSGVCNVCNRSDGIDQLATHCRYCGARMKEDTE